MEESISTKNEMKKTSDADSSGRLDAQFGAYHAKTLLAQTRLFETLDALDEIERTHAEELALNQRREGRMRLKMKSYAEASRQAEEEKDDMRQAVLKLIDKIEKYNGYKSLRPSQLHISSMLEPIEPTIPRRVSPTDVEDLLSYAASMIEVVRRERALERKAHQKTREWAQSRITVLEAQLSRREIELARCATHCFSSESRNDVPLSHEPMPYQQYLDTLQRTMSKNRTLELEINALSEKLGKVRLHEQKRPDDPSNHLDTAPQVEPNPEAEVKLTKPQFSVVAGLDQQVQQLGVLIDALKEDRKIWQTIIDDEKHQTPSGHPFEAISRRVDAVEEECRKLRCSEEDLRQQLEATRHRQDTRESELNSRIQLLESRIPRNQPEPRVPPADEDSDTIRLTRIGLAQQPQSSPKAPLPENLLEDGGEVSMDLATPLIPLIFMEPPTETLEPLDSPNPAPQQPSSVPSPLDLSPSL